MDKRVLIVDDDRLIREMARDGLVREGFEVSTAASGAEALTLLADEGPYDLVLTDLSMREMDGMQLMEEVKRCHPRTDVVILTAYASLESALQALRLGAADYLRKPIKPPEIVYCVNRALLRRQLLDENQSLRGSVQAFEACRVLTSSLETPDIFPMSLDILLRLLGRTRAVGRLVSLSPRISDGIYLRGFDDEGGRILREEIERGKLFDPLAIETPDRGVVPSRMDSDARAVLERLGVAEEDVLALPVRLEGRQVGAIWVFAAARGFEERERRTADLVVAHAELALLNAERFVQAREKAFIDDVTDLYNARYLFAALDREVSRAARSSLQLSVLFLDLDRFKTVNDRFGHLVGSRVLRELGQLLHKSVRSIDTVGRYGGDEFTVVLVETPHAAAMHVAERIRQMVERTPFGSDAGLELPLSVSVGVATFPQHGRDRERLLDQSDKAMYLGKSLGRNRVCSSDELTNRGSSG
jgi:two-component system cell cycle response regulator